MNLLYKRRALLAIALMGNLSAMTQITRKSPALTRSALAAARSGKQSQASTTLVKPTTLTPISKAATVNVSRSFSNMPRQEVGQQKRILTVKGLAKALTLGTAGTLLLSQALELYQISNKLIDPKFFDENVIPEEFSRATVKIYNIKDYQVTGQGSGIIVATEQNVFFLTAAHCILDQQKQFIVVDDVRLLVEPIIVDRDNDVAVLFISSTQIQRYYQKNNNKIFPSIDKNQLTAIKPQIKEIVAVQGYPGIMEQMQGFYRKKYLSIKPEVGVTFNPEDLSGTSGGPVIIVNDKKAKIFGLVRAGSQPRLISIFGMKMTRPLGFAVASGVGQLPSYVQKAEEIKKGEQESWSDFFKRIFQYRIY
ncbi:MAG: serine protease [Candidatus Babeliaceae bacterium]|nr:serine protease [Candidatus Babeliaceae bacterium]